jgi:hypothetical protein
VVVVDWTTAGLRIAAQPHQPPLFGPRAWILPDPRGGWQPIDAIPTPDAREHSPIRERFEPDFTGGPPSLTSDGSGWIYPFAGPPSRSDLSPPLEFVIVRFAGKEVRVSAPAGAHYPLADMAAVVVPD